MAPDFPCVLGAVVAPEVTFERLTADSVMKP